MGLVTRAEALAMASRLAGDPGDPDLLEAAAAARDSGWGNVVTYSPKVFIPLTKLCRDVCHYCTFARPPIEGRRAYLTLDEVLEVARAGEAAGCREALFTTGLLIGIGETWDERVDTLLAIREAHERWGHVQEVIVQNFRAKAGTPMHAQPEPSDAEMVATVALARLVLGPDMSVQCPPNLAGSETVLRSYLGAGINDWGGVSPVTI